MNISSLIKITEKSKKRLGQGHGSGRVKTAGRGTKGQKARGKIPLRFEGGALPLVKRMPFRRGNERNKSFKTKPVIINVDALNTLPKNTVVDVATLVKHNIIKTDEATKNGVKVLGNGDLTVALTVKLAASKGAVAKIEKAGGSVAPSA
jgi:large subunit ribosomal protein L15